MISIECLIQVRRVDDGRPKYGQTFYNNRKLNNIPETTGMLFRKSALIFYPLEKYSNILDDEHMMLLVEFAEQIRENNAALQYFQGTLTFNKFSGKLREIYEIYYRIFQFLKFNN
ncbi:hypothetical protein [Lactococcus lactis]|uniref:Uncharacterized protein n=1 Tax=Lactococcus lactis subsp. lactis NCDO 2118 TaxID=1117941 RepID=A0ABC8A4K8_LACLL|nr:hypothetical protein [Lactococcus lactis]ABX75591.1 Hypothetical protein LLKF_0602 [Lactococcus lactis subsp. lactis KF147]AII12103.1 hypothetical protein NCDO2118_0607 [Lactococcus lactis subsp. lactis NCDO 2118]